MRVACQLPAQQPLASRHVTAAAHTADAGGRKVGRISHAAPLYTLRLELLVSLPPPLLLMPGMLFPSPVPVLKAHGASHSPLLLCHLSSGAPFCCWLRHYSAACCFRLSVTQFITPVF
jgi:hypothetical protein